MRTATFLNVFLFIISLYIIHHRVYSNRLSNRKLNSNNGMESYLMDDSSSPIDEDLMTKHLYPSPLARRASDSAEKYFNWASKTNRPMEYFRGKRFWLFTKKDEHTSNQETVPGANQPSKSPSQGIWRSGIVGRRRRWI